MIIKTKFNQSIVTLDGLKYKSKHKCEACGSHWLKPDKDCLFCLYRKETKDVDSKVQDG